MQDSTRAGMIRRQPVQSIELTSNTGVPDGGWDGGHGGRRGHHHHGQPDRAVPPPPSLSLSLSLLPNMCLKRGRVLLDNLIKNIRESDMFDVRHDDAPRSHTLAHGSPRTHSDGPTPNTKQRTDKGLNNGYGDRREIAGLYPERLLEPGRINYIDNICCVFVETTREYDGGPDSTEEVTVDFVMNHITNCDGEMNNCTCTQCHEAERGARARLAEADDGRGVWDWLCEGRDDDDEPLHDHGGDDVRYAGIVPLLELRGGGAAEDALQPPGAADSPSDDEAAEYERRVLARHGQDGRIYCGHCGKRLGPLDEDWIECWCGRLQCEPCMSLPCPRCGDDVQCQRDVDRAVTVSLWSALGFDDRPAADVRERRSMTISGIRDGRRVIVCGTCARDVAEAAATHCACGKVHCPECLRYSGCDCSGGTHGDGCLGGSVSALPPASTTAHDGPFDWNNLTLGEAAARGMAIFDENVDDVAPHDTEVINTGPAAARCSRCHLDLGIGGVSWRICTCRASTCIACSPTGCGLCGGQLEASPEYSPAQHFHMAADDVDTRMSDAGRMDESPTVEDVPTLGEPVVITPEQASERRRKLKIEKKESNAASRARSHADRRRQVADGRRPRRPPKPLETLDIVTVNVNAATTFRDEYMHGTVLNQCPLIAVQEHGLAQENQDAFKSWLLKVGASGVMNPAYFKRRAYGGGTAFIVHELVGLRPLPPLTDDQWQGRNSWGSLDDHGGIVVACIYGFSGAMARGQVAFWRALAARLLVLGRPFVIMGDFQVEPEAMRRTELCRLLDAVIVSPGCATNLVTGTQIDYFVVSRALLPGGPSDDECAHDDRRYEEPTATAIYGCRFSPHIPVRLRLTTPHSRREVQRLAVPRPLPVSRPIGPQPPGCRVDWSGWAQRSGLAADQSGNDISADLPTVEAALESWFAGFEAELFTVFGVYGSPGETAYSGIGSLPEVVAGSGQGRFRDVHDDGGTIGHRLAWAAKALHQVASAAERVRRAAAAAMTESERQRNDRIIDIIRRLGHRAEAFLREVPKLNFDIDGAHDAEAEAALRRSLRYLAAAIRPRRGERPLIWQWMNGDGLQAITEARGLHHETELVLEKRMRTARGRVLAAARRWARMASLGESHAATKDRDASIAYSASSDKGHRGEATPQLAADRGLREWSVSWGASAEDAAEEVLRTVDCMDEVKREFPEIVLPRLRGCDLKRGAGHFKWLTGTGADGARLRHLLYASGQAADALALILMHIEALRRWPAAVRIVIANAIPKKAGGSRLIGLATMIYRLWAKVRYEQVQATLEQRIERPFLDAAPGKGAARSAFGAAFRAEAAAARKEVAATTMVDIGQFYESVQIADVAAGARVFGMPEAVIMLSAHIYLGPRRIRVGKAISAAAFPTRTVLPGCAWATVHVRLMLVKPVDRFMKHLNVQIADWLVDVFLSLYVDDWVLSTIGQASRVAFVHPIITRALIQWIRSYLHLRIAPDKIGCVVTTPKLRDVVGRHLKYDNVPVSLHGELLGVDYSAGGHMYGRGKGKAMNKRLLKHGRRTAKVRWLHRVGGRSRAVVRGGITAGMRYGDEVCGTPPGLVRTLRLTHGAVSSIKAVGGSLTARLAVGGDRFVDFDPMVYRSNPALLAALAIIWDQPRRRRDFIDAWRAAREELIDKEPRDAWRRVRGPVGAAMLQLLRVGAKWNRPFTIELMGHAVEVLDTPPRQVAMILAEHARIHADHVMLTGLAVERGWPIERVLYTYRYGIDWESLRGALADRDGRLTAIEKRALGIVAVGGLWPEARRWTAGYCGVGTCTSCFMAIGNYRHRLVECHALEDHLLWHRIAGRLGHDNPALTSDASLSPLIEMALPPKILGWSPLEGENVQGSLHSASGEKSYVDGSGRAQDMPHQRVSTWAVVRRPAEGGLAGEVVRGRVAGWFRTVPRAEIRAAIEWLEHAQPTATGVSDCQHVVDVIAGGVSARWTSAASFNADLWKRAKKAVDKLGGNARLVKTRAHRSRSAAIDDTDEPFEHWVGNSVADYHARQKSEAELRLTDGESIVTRFRDEAASVIRRVAVAAGWVLRQLPATNKDPKRTRRYDRQGADDNRCGDHELVRAAGGRLQCKRCRLFTRTASSFKTLRSTPCRGDIASRSHVTHSLAWTAGVVWCRRCGAYASRLPRRLMLPCAGHPMSEAQANVLRRLRCGLTPTTANYLRAAAVGDDDHGRDPRQGADGGDTGGGGGQAALTAVSSGAGGNVGDVAGDALAPPPAHGLGQRQADEGGPAQQLERDDVDDVDDREPGVGHPSPSSSSSQPGIVHSAESGHSMAGASSDVVDGQTLAGPPHGAPPQAASGDGDILDGGPGAFGGHEWSQYSHPTSAPATVNPLRRRLSSKQPREQLFDERSKWCLADFTGGWTLRLGPRLPVAGGCSTCTAPTRATCRGCARPLCFQCLQGRQRCPRLLTP